VSSPTKKPYRRFRAHGRAQGEPSDDLAALRELNTAAPKAPERGSKKTAAAPRSRPVVPAARRRWWSLRGVGKGGIAARLVGLLVIAFVGWATLGYFTLRGAANDANSRISATARRALADPKGGLLGTPQNILVLGSDADRDRTGARADTILIMRTDPDAGRIRYLSIPRDLRVEYPGQGNIKIGEAFAYGGNRGVIRAIDRTLGLPIHHVMLIDFKGVSKMVDAVGGITLDNPFDLKDCAYPGGRNVSFPRGKISLDGAEALVYSRVRKCDGDLERARRQQLVVAALKSKVISWTGLPSAPWRGARMVRAMSTDLSATDLAKLGWLQGKLTTDPADRDVLIGEPANIGGTFYFLFDPGRAGPQLERFQGRGSD
jgi:polyisoprenyl-teichoic acid--peptidoglycan teichoic acid transferase